MESNGLQPAHARTLRTNRRSFFGLLGGAISAAFLAAPEKLLWVPGKKLISIPKRFGMSEGPILDTFEIPASPGNVLIPPEAIAREMLRALERNLSFVKQLRDFSAWPSPGQHEGDRIKIHDYAGRWVKETERAIVGARHVRFMAEVDAKRAYPEWKGLGA